MSLRWYTADFDSLDWQGVHVHGWRIVERGPGEADLALDIDWMLGWPDDVNPEGGYLVAQAMLVFHDVAALRVLIDFAACSAASGPFSIEALRREPVAAAGPARDAVGDGADEAWGEGPVAGLDEGGDSDDYGPWRWRIDLAWPEGELTFEASGFSQWLVGDPQVLDGPVLPAALRS